MNDTVLKYIKIFGDYSLKDISFNEVDALILSLISYIDFTGIVKKDRSITIDEANKLMKKKFNLKIKDKFLNNTKKMFITIADTKRYGNLKLENYQKINNKEEQFGAITIRLDKHTIFISYEGTEDNLIGWEEDFRISHMFPIPAQKSACAYLSVQQKRNRNIYIGGHSKGGNLSMAALLNASFWTRLKIRQVYNFDGPGFLCNQVNSTAFKKCQRKIITYIPEESVIGVLLDNPTKTKVVKSYAKKTLQHDAFTWQCYGSLFIEGILSDYSYNIKRKVKQIIGSYPIEERQLFVDTFFKILYNSGYTEKSELNKVNFNKVKNILKEMHKLKKEEKNILLDVLKIFLKKEDIDEKKDSNT